jgi:predicted Fe-S protein YdhL (DUF1289 family)
MYRRRPRAGVVLWDAMTTTFRAIPSPCIGICSLGEDGLCMGCHRTPEEIAQWIAMGDDERLRLMEDVLPTREAKAAVRG